jgi:hypothetical protein
MPSTSQRTLDYIPETEFIRSETAETLLVVLCRAPLGSTSAEGLDLSGVNEARMLNALSP